MTDTGPRGSDGRTDGGEGRTDGGDGIPAGWTEVSDVGDVTEKYDARAATLFAREGENGGDVPEGTGGNKSGVPAEHGPAERDMVPYDETEAYGAVGVHISPAGPPDLHADSDRWRVGVVTGDPGSVSGLEPVAEVEGRDGAFERARRFMLTFDAADGDTDERVAAATEAIREE